MFQNYFGDVRLCFGALGGGLDFIVGAGAAGGAILGTGAGGGADRSIFG